jgi:hypothetical protein
MVQNSTDNAGKLGLPQLIKEKASLVATKADITGHQEQKHT